jgi:hypothetical protein
VLTRSQQKALRIFRGFATEFPLEQAVRVTRRTCLRELDDEDWADPELQGAMADACVELKAEGKLWAES